VLHYRGEGRTISGVNTVTDPSDKRLKPFHQTISCIKIGSYYTNVTIWGCTGTEEGADQYETDTSTKRTRIESHYCNKTWLAHEIWRMNSVQAAL